ncbi:sugar ABC transporter ATP-binding protein [Tropicimonas sp. IMCC34043]|uniref:sugar ABC transporter ATP-binding protein n=1 Tax=Tropicimonas sp. IMCC34043 TaxID=2248760 RepID=UPI000E238976|nr:sugar ABC transporter ATP-binding protein [Tropicimonas sp. IMCC34043]
MADVLLEVKGLKKSFGGVAALSDGRFRLEAGSIHALCGGNGAGKSTLLTIVMGIQSRDGGVILRDGREVSFSSPGEALANGISIIEQELSPVPAMTVAENIFLGREPLRSFGRIDFATMNAHAQELLDKLGFDIPPTTRMMDLSVAKIQLVEIAKALSYDAQIIIMDEPTSALGESEVEQLFEAIRRLKAQGKGVVYVSHRLTEIFDIADAYTVFRDGAFVQDGRIADVTKDDLIHLIVGRPLAEKFVKENHPSDEVTLAVSGIDSRNGVRDVSFEVHAGEILALYGLMGSGRTEIFERIFGMTRHTKGTIHLGGKLIAPRSPAEAIHYGISFVTEDRKESGLVLQASVRNNLCMASLVELSSLLGMTPGAEKSSATRMIDLFSVKTPSDRLEVSGLSGGNQQKVVLGKWFMTEPKILLLDEPTRGVDVGAKKEIYGVMSAFAAKGGTVIMISSENEEVLGMADRVIVMKDGRVAGELGRKEMSAGKLVSLAA